MSVPEALKSIVNTVILRESFESEGNDSKTKNILKELVSLFVFLLVLTLIAFFGKLVWNEFLAGQGSNPGVFTFVKPLPTFMHAIAVYITIGLFFGRC
jgi:magnesium-transporting ATPase (P-type)